MSAQQPQHAPVRLLIAESSENAAHQFDSLLRDAGIATRMELTDLSMAQAALPDADLMLCNGALPYLEKLLPRFKAAAPHVPIIILNNDESPLSVAEGMALGAADVVDVTETKQLVLVVKRELDNVCQTDRLKQTRRALNEAEQRCQLLLQSSKAAIAYVHEGMHIHANAGYFKLFGFDDADDLLGIPLIDLLEKESGEALKVELKQFRIDHDEENADKHEAVLEFTGKSNNGDVIQGNMTLASAEYEGEHCLQVTVRTANPTEPATDESSSNVDASRSNGHATPLPAFLNDSTALFASTDEGFRCTFVGVIDKFEKLQFEHGILGAEQIAHEVESALRTSVGDVPFFKLASSQFAVSILVADRITAVAKMDSHRQVIQDLLLEVNSKTVRPTLSFGGAIYEDKNDTGAETCLNSAFAAALSTPCLDGNHVELPRTENEDGPSEEAAKVLSLINEAIENEKFVLLFQPTISLRGDSDEHYEVFLRMFDRSGKQMAPGEFLRTAIDYGVAGKIDRWVILQSIKMLSVHRSKGNNTRLTINLTSNSVADPEFIQWLGVAIKAARLPSDAVVFQITEQDAIEYMRQTQEFVEGLKALHCRASLSRFGLCDKPFEVLRHLPVDFVKLDRIHIERLKEDPELKEEITGMIRDLQSAGKLTIVPMVESANVLSALWQAGANYIQGHYLQEPSADMDYDFSTDD
ncbi:MAG: EAL domain-containing protein [Gammaproteobacteria bacterium]|nr:EAL domain-containing protein [Gammaproteobacteria bacterium]